MQRVAIARALVNDPDIILADEPSGALDSKTSIKIMELIKEISKDKLVIMVTHNEELAKEYSSRIINLKDGKIINDSNPKLDGDNTDEHFNIRKTKMSFLTALKLSLNNIYTKKGRTFLTSFASSIGIIGIALILSIANGFNKQIDNYEASTMSSFPISINKEVSAFSNEDFNKEKNDNNDYPKESFLYPYSKKENKKVHVNNITQDYTNYINNIDKNLINAISYYRIINFNLLSENDSIIKQIDSGTINLTALPEDFGNKNNYLKDNYDLLSGSFPNSDNDVVLIVDKKNRIDKTLLDALNIKEDEEKVSFNSVLGKELKLVKNDDYYNNVGNNTFIKNEVSKELYHNPNNETIKIVGIVRAKKDNSLSAIMDNMSDMMGKSGTSRLGYTNALIEKMVLNNYDSEVVNAQKKSEGIVTMGNISFESVGIDKKEALTMLGANDVPMIINIYPNSFEDKEKIKTYLDKYNAQKKEKDKIIYTDYAKKISSLSSNIMDGITVVLIAFSSISLLVSSIMIGIITYISVLERTKEIGILRSLGARKKDIARVFNAETFIIGLISGIIGIIITMLLLIPVNSILYSLTNLKNVGILNLVHAVLLVMVSVMLTLVAGAIPAKMASKKDPVDALRTE